MRTFYVPIMHCEKMAVTDMLFRQSAVIEFLVKEGNAAEDIYKRLRDVHRNNCLGASSVRRWVKHFKDGKVTGTVFWVIQGCTLCDMLEKGGNDQRSSLSSDA